MLTRVSGSKSYYFRRRVPEKIRYFFGKSEIWISLKSSNRIESKKRSGVIYGLIQNIFDDCNNMAQDEEYIQIVEKTLTDLESVIHEQEKIIEIVNKKHRLNLIKNSLQSHKRFRDFIDEQSKNLEKISKGVERLTRENLILSSRLDESRIGKNDTSELLKQMSQMMISLSSGSQMNFNNSLQQEIKEDSPLFSEVSKMYLEEKETDYKNEKDRRTLYNTFGLFVEICGDRPINSYRGKDVYHFIQTCRRIPKTYGKSIYDTNVLDGISKADLKESGGVKVLRMSDSTIENRVGFIKGLWKFLLPLEKVEKNIWDGFTFKTETVREIRDWSEENLSKLLSNRFLSKSLSRQTFGWIVSIGAYSGMRQGEICHLRVDDFVKTDDGWMMYVQEHEPTLLDGKLVKFSPKTECGERVVPVHPELVRVGLIKYVERMKQAGRTYIFPDLTPRGHDNQLTPRFQQAFSRHKISCGISDDTVFHSFRHSVSTILRNEDTSIREVWIDSVLGHLGDSSKKSQGITTYLHKIGTKNLKKTINKIKYPDSFDISKLF